VSSSLFSSITSPRTAWFSSSLLKLP
jgi:hypothetical protein